jgi:hypothetical protein
MTLDPTVLVPMPEQGIVIYRNGPYLPVYKVIRCYRNQHGSPTSERECIGKKDPESGMLIPNSNYRKHFPLETPLVDYLPRYDSVRSIGGSFLVDHVMEDLGLKETLDKVFDEARSQLVHTAALYMVARNNVFDGVLDYCEGFTLGEKPLTSQKSSDLFASITFDERMEFFHHWVAKQPPGEYLAYDVTSFSTYAKGIIGGERGNNRDGDKLPQINLGCYVSESTGLPVFYTTYPGSIVDVSHLPYMMAYNEDLGIVDVCHLIDRGFCSAKNVKYMKSNQIKFILGVIKHHLTAKRAIESVLNDITSYRYHIKDSTYGRVIDGYYYGENTKIHIFFDQILADNQKITIRNKIDEQENFLRKIEYLKKEEIQKYRKFFIINRSNDGSFTYEKDYDKIDELFNKCGIFCILTNTNLNSVDILDRYRHRDVIEKKFDDIKNYIHMKRLRTHNTATTDGKLFCAFISLIIASEIGVKLRELMRKKSWSKDDVIREMEKIRVVMMNVKNPRLINPVTKNQRLIMEAFGLSEDDLKRYALREWPSQP